MPPLVYETAAWLRFYTCVPIPALPGEGSALSEPDPARTARAVPVAGAVIGWIGGIVLVVVWLLGASPFVAAAAAVLALVVLTAGRSERALAASAERLSKWDSAATGTGFAAYGAIAIVLAVLLRAGALDALAARGAAAAGIALVCASAVARAAAVGFTLVRPAGETPETGRASSLQWLALIGLGFGVLTVLPGYGVGATIATLAAAAGAASLVTAFVPRSEEDGGRAYAGTADLTAEIAFLIALVAFARSA